MRQSSVYEYLCNLIIDIDTRMFYEALPFEISILNIYKDFLYSLQSNYCDLMRDYEKAQDSD